MIMINAQVGLSSAGNYSCSTHQSNTATVTIIVVQGNEHSSETSLDDAIASDPKL